MIKTIKTFAIEAVLLYIFWIALTGIKYEEVIIGLFISVTTAYVATERRLIYFFSQLNFRKLWIVIPFVVIYILQEIKNHIYMISRIYSIKPDIKPAIIKIPLYLRHNVSITILGNAITMQPGTFTLEAERDHIIIHTIDKRGEPVNSIKKMEHKISEVLR